MQIVDLNQLNEPATVSIQNDLVLDRVVNQKAVLIWVDKAAEILECPSFLPDSDEVSQFPESSSLPENFIHHFLHGGKGDNLQTKHPFKPGFEVWLVEFPLFLLVPNSRAEHVHLGNTHLLEVLFDYLKVHDHWTSKVSDDGFLKVKEPNFRIAHSKTPDFSGVLFIWVMQ
jgi:hypothetical protein